MGWFLALTLTGILGWLGLRYRRFIEHWRHLQTIVDDLAAGREPKSFVFFNGGRFTQIAAKLEQLADSQERLRRRRSRQEMNLQTILSSMEEAVLVVDRLHKIRLVNPALTRMFNLGIDPLGQSVLQLLREVSVDEVVTLALESWAPQSRELYWHGNKNPRHLALSVTPMRNASGEEGVVAIFRDISRLKQLEEMRKEFVANVSHELRTPLSIFRGYLENLQDSPDMPRSELVDNLAVLDRHALRLNALVDDLLIVARLESREMQLQREPIELVTFLAELVDDWKLRSSRKNIRMILEVPDILPTLFADVLRVEQVMNNLIDNAIKYTPAGGIVTIRAFAGTSEIRIEVCDNGVGIGPDDLPHIFERFYRVEKARSREQGGTGLGLSIVKHIVQAHAGQVFAESAPGKGLMIAFTLPLSGENVPSQTDC
jgi:two-component system phosphate regulon sensor histidine kinase PhoR